MVNCASSMGSVEMTFASRYSCARSPYTGIFHSCSRGNVSEREFVIDNLLDRIQNIIVMIRCTGLAPWEFEFPFPCSLISTFLGCRTFRVLHGRTGTLHHPGGNPGANLKSISHRCYLFEVAFVWELSVSLKLSDTRVYEPHIRTGYFEYKNPHPP